MDSARVNALRFWEAVDAFATSQEGPVAAALTAAVKALRASLTDAELQVIVQTGNVEAVLARIDTDALKFAIRHAVTIAAEKTPEGFTANNGQVVGAWPQIIRVRFDTLAPYAVAALRDFESRALEVINQDIRAGFLAAIESGLARGKNPIETARTVRDLIGLPDNLVRAIDRYESQLLSGNPTEMRAIFDRALRDQRFDRTVMRAIEANQPVAPERVAQMVEAMKRRALQHNAVTLARTATMDGLNLGNRLAWQQALAEQKVLIHELRRFWIVARDERTCPRCLTIPQLNPVGRGMDEPFVTPYDGLVMYPTLHFRCRCIVYTRYDA